MDILVTGLAALVVLSLPVLWWLRRSDDTRRGREVEEIKTLAKERSEKLDELLSRVDALDERDSWRRPSSDEGSGSAEHPRADFAAGGLFGQASVVKEDFAQKHLAALRDISPAFDALKGVNPVLTQLTVLGDMNVVSKNLLAFREMGSALGSVPAFKDIRLSTMAPIVKVRVPTFDVLGKGSGSAPSVQATVSRAKGDVLAPMSSRTYGNVDAWIEDAEFGEAAVPDWICDEINSHSPGARRQLRKGVKLYGGGKLAPL